MKTMAEKTAMVNDFNKRLDLLVINSLQAIKNKDLFAMISNSAELKKYSFKCARCMEMSLKKRLIRCLL